MGIKEGGPESPEFVNATFYFFDNASSPDVEDLLDEKKQIHIPSRTYTVANWTLDKMNGTLNTSKPLAVVTHGLTGSKRTPWMKPLVKELLVNVRNLSLIILCIFCIVNYIITYFRS
ncbi:hypothetical protein HPB48_022491 [Haemaphysalis longicornis]|uniref:Uncharacterized protein n=1 Tax=Haemaphysalis longicornis TaxID=44386 RepID=A0A9J6GMA4_HAELO|nr:hypothetical protein HPB48_022491 [Haemaphysalis longicornis]